MCRSRLWLLYWVSTQIFRTPPLARLDSAKSMSRYKPPNGTAGLARSAVSGLRRVPAPPASTIPRTDGCAMSGPPKTLARAFVRRLKSHAPAYQGVLGRAHPPVSPDLAARWAGVVGLRAGPWPARPP